MYVDIKMKFLQSATIFFFSLRDKILPQLWLSFRMLTRHINDIQYHHHDHVNDNVCGLWLCGGLQYFSSYANSAYSLILFGPMLL